MALVPWCPQCLSPLADALDGFGCDDHGRVVPLWRAPLVDYAAFGEVVALAAGLPTYLPWPLSPGWTVADVACVADPERGVVPRATVTTTLGSSAVDGPVTLTVVVEEPGVGLGARIARSAEVDPGPVVDGDPPVVRVRLDHHPVPLWQVPGGGDAGDGEDDEDPLARSVFAGEAGGRWLWLVITPASAALLLRDEWLLADAGGFGPSAVDIPFGGPPPAW